MSLYAFDGTWNSDLDVVQRHTNVFKFYNAYKGEKFYFRGIGNKDDNIAIQQIVGGISGLGGKGIIRNAYRTLAEQLEADGVGAITNIDIVGFSRGAALALHFANVVQRQGVPILSSRKRVVERKKLPGKKRRKSVWHYVYQYHHPKPPIRFLGLWDTVASFGLPGNAIDLGYKLGIPHRVKKTCHAMAMDEHRSLFPITRVEGAEEVWFMGRHTNVGGGYRDARLSDFALQWMIEKAEKSQIKFFKSHTNNIKPDPSGTMPPAKGKKSIRVVYEGDKAHRSVIKDRYPEIDWRTVKIVS